MRLLLCGLALLIFTNGTTFAGGRSTSIGLVNLDDDPKAKRFDHLKAGFDEAIRQGAGSVIDGAEVVARPTIARFLRPGCGLDVPGEEWQKLEHPRADRFMDYLVLYCSSGPGPSVTLAVFTGPGDKPFMRVTMDAQGGAVGRPALRSLARAILQFSALRFSP